MHQLARAADDIRSSPMWHATPIVFVVDDDISVPLELLIAPTYCYS
jgi:hypothetical protein